MTDSITPSEINEIKNMNRELCENYQEFYSVDDKILQHIFNTINTCNSVKEEKRRIIKRASYILSLITNLQPFHDFNRHIAYAVTMFFLRRNNLNIPLKTPSEEKEIFYVMDKTKDKNSDDSTLCSEIEDFIASKVTDYTVKKYY